MNVITIKPIDLITIKLKFILFAGSGFYPAGGWEDFQGYFDTIEEARKHLFSIAEDFCCDPWGHIVKDGKIIETWRDKGTGIGEIIWECEEL